MQSRARRLIALPLGLLLVLLLLLPGAVAGEEEWSEVIRGDPSTGVVALTFDAGGVAGPAHRVLDALRERGVRVTFFLSGHWVDAYPDLAAQVARDGHELANHSYHHPDLTRLSDDEIVWELDYTDHVVARLTGLSTRPYFRPPFGARNRRVLDVAAASGFRSVFWSLDSGDWRERVTAEYVADRVLRLAEPGDIVVMHVASEATAAALPLVLDDLLGRGWSVGTVSEVLGITPAAPPDATGAVS